MDLLQVLGSMCSSGEPFSNKEIVESSTARKSACLKVMFIFIGKASNVSYPKSEAGPGTILYAAIMGGRPP